MIKYIIPLIALYAAFLSMVAATVYAPPEADPDTSVALEIDPDVIRQDHDALDRMLLLRSWRTGTRAYVRGRCSPWGSIERELCIWDEAVI